MQEVTSFLTGAQTIDKACQKPWQKSPSNYLALFLRLIIDALVDSGLASSNQRLAAFLDGGSISINGAKVTGRDFYGPRFLNGHLLLRRGKAYKDSALISLKLIKRIPHIAHRVQNLFWFAATRTNGAVKT